MTRTVAKWLAVALGAALILTGCGLVSIDKEMESAQTDAQVVAEFTGGTVTYGEAMSEYQNMASMYEAYGYPLTDPDDIAQAKQEVLDMLVERNIVKVKAQELGLTELSEDEKAEISEQAAAEYEEAITYYMGYFQGDTDAETRQNSIDYLESAGYSIESVEEYYLENAWQDKIKDEITKDVVVTDQQVQAVYDASVAEDQETFTEDSYYFENAATYGDTVAWVPDGYRAVKHILLQLDDEDSSALFDLTSQLEDVNVRIEELQNPDAGLGEEGDESAFADAGVIGADEALADATTSDGGADEAPADADASDGDAGEAPAEPDEEFIDQGEFSEEFDEGELDFEEDFDDADVEDAFALDGMTLAELQAKRSELEQQIATLKAASLAKLQPTIDEIQAKLLAGEDFDALIDAYGQDDGMKTEPTKTNGYYVSANSQMWDDEFTNGAMALQNIGDVSAPVLGQSGVHIIKYLADLTGGAVPLDQIRETIRTEAEEQAKNDLYDSTVGQWVSAANVKTYVDRMK